MRSNLRVQSAISKLSPLNLEQSYIRSQWKYLDEISLKICDFLSWQKRAGDVKRWIRSCNAMSVLAVL